MIRFLDRIVRAKFVRDAVAVAKAALGITSPSREFLAAVQAAERRPYVEPVPLPWYAARGPGERWESPELAAAARRVRRLIRRHWRALAFELESPIALTVLAAMKDPVVAPQSVSLLGIVAQCERHFGPAPAGAVVVPVEACPNCAHVEAECQCGDLRDCW